MANKKSPATTDRPAADINKLSAKDQAHYDKVFRQFRYAGGVTILLIGGGMVFYHIVEKLNWVDAFYFCTVTLATVGYGDIVPHTTAGKIFTAFYILMGVSIIATFAHLIVERAVAKRRFRDSQSNRLADL